MMTSLIKTVFKKELKDTLRDRRTVFAALAYSFIGPAMLLVIINFAASIIEESSDPVIAIQNADQAPYLMAHLKGEGYEIQTFDSDKSPANGIGDVDALLTIMPGYKKALSEGKGASVRIYVDETKQSKRRAAGILARDIAGFSRQIVDQRMVANGMPPSMRQAIRVEQVDLSLSGAQAKQISFMLLYFFILAPFFSSLSVSIDTAAGERERKSLQTLLVQPISTLDLVIGKWLMAVMFGIVGTAVTVFGGMNVLTFAPLDVIGIKLNLDVASQVALFLSLAPLAFLVSSLQIWVSLMAKSYKEANTYLQLMSFTPVLIGVSLELSGETLEGALSFAPIVAQLQASRGIITDGAGDIPTLVIGGVVCLLLSAIGLYFTSKKLQSETILSAA